MKIEGYFRGIRNANEAVSELKASGFPDCFSDLNDHDVTDMNTKINVAGTSTGSSLSDLVLHSGKHIGDPSLGPLTAASPMVSGMGGFEEIANINCKVVVSTDEKNMEKAKQILTKHGADLDDPNVKIPRGLDNISADTLDEAMNRALDNMNDRM